MAELELPIYNILGRNKSFLNLGYTSILMQDASSAIAYAVKLGLFCKFLKCKKKKKELYDCDYFFYFNENCATIQANGPQFIRYTAHKLKGALVPNFF